ncbi:MAG: hypothetical protein F6K21_32605 [Symploca sp. SIO2D2]|nr:hypothetical protein [Symploca sp. SIO2D2]
MKKNIIQRIKRFQRLPKLHKASTIRTQLISRITPLASLSNSLIEKRWDSIPSDHDLILNQSRAYTTAAPNVLAGIGHTLAEYNTGLIWARETGATYVHYPLLQPWEEYLNFGYGIPTIVEKNISNLKRFRLPRFESDITSKDFDLISKKMAYVSREEPILFLLGDGQNSHKQDSTSEELRSRYWANNAISQRLDLRKSGLTNISVHVRRRNATDMNNPAVHDPQSAAYKSRYLANDFFMNACKCIEQELGREKTHFNIFSQGKPEDFETFESLHSVELQLQTDQYETFHNLVLADILIVSPSSFSFKAGMLCKGKKIARSPWWHAIPTNDEWIAVPEGLNTAATFSTISKGLTTR